MRILESIVSGIPLVLILRTRMWDPYADVVFGALTNMRTPLQECVGLETCQSNIGKASHVPVDSKKSWSMDKG